MKRQILIGTAVALGALSVGFVCAQTNTQNPAFKTKSLSTLEMKVSKGDNLTLRKRPSRTLSTTRRLNEGFEGCTLLSADLPEGWTSKSLSTSTDPLDHWYAVTKSYADENYYPRPAEGNVMMCVYFDTTYKDEWLISPEFEIPDESGYLLTFNWFTTPARLYMCDRYHIDFDEGVFTDRVQIMDFEVLVKEDGGEWQRIYNLESDFVNKEYNEIADEFYNYEGLQTKQLSLDDFAGKKIQLGFRYYGTDADAFFLDGITVDMETPNAYFMPPHSRLYYGATADEYAFWPETSIEFYPVNHPVTWYNFSSNEGDTHYTWQYTNLDDNGVFSDMTSDDQWELSVTYRPDYTDEQSLRNNMYSLPTLVAQGSNGARGSYTHKSDMLQAGGKPETVYSDGSNVEFTSYLFDINNDGLGMHLEENETLGLYGVPIFGYSETSDAWWEAYSYPEGNPEEKYSYVDGFINMFIPNEGGAKLVVNGVSALAYGTIYPETQFTCKVYLVDEDGQIRENPIMTKKISGDDVINIKSEYTRDYLVMNFPFDAPLIFSTDGTPYGYRGEVYAYLVEISDYHDPAIEYFVPLQSLVPNEFASEEYEYGFSLGFYHHYWPNDDALLDAIDYVGYFKNEWGKDLETCFAIGLDAYYPWLEVEGDKSTISIEDAPVAVSLLGYYAAEDYEVTAPEWLDVKLDGRYTTTVTFDVLQASDEERIDEVVISAPGVSKKFFVKAKEGYQGGILGVGNDPCTTKIYNLQGIEIKNNELPKGIYIINGKKTKI